MKILIVGCGLVGTSLARELRAEGHTVIGTTTTPGKVKDLSEVCSEVRVLRGSDRSLVHQAASGCDAIIVTAGPAAQQAMTPEQRKATYTRVLVETAESVASAPIAGPIIALSSFSVYGDTPAGVDVVDERSPLTDSDDASPACFQAAERTYLTKASGRACVFRCPDIHGGDDPPIAVKVRMAHQILGGSVPFHDDALFYRIHVLDVVRAIRFALERRLSGVYNLTHDEVPPRNKPYFDAIAKAQGLGPLHFRNELLSPTRPVSNQKLVQLGFSLAHTTPERMLDAGTKLEAAAPAKALDTRGRSVALAALDTILKRLSLAEVKGSDGGDFLTLRAAGGPLEGKQVGFFRVYRGGPVHELVYSAMTVPELGIDTHQIFAYTAPDSLVPHLTIDVAISPNTEGTFHVGVDLMPRVDPGASLAYVQHVYARLTQVLADTMEIAGVGAATTVGPLQRALRSPWLLAAFVHGDSVARVKGAVDAYVERWLALCAEGIPEPIASSVAWQDAAARDRHNRAALFHPDTNRVWILLDRLVGAESGARMREILASQRT